MCHGINSEEKFMDEVYEDSISKVEKAFKDLKDAFNQVKASKDDDSIIKVVFEN